MIRLLRLNKFPILKQLQIEEALYRAPNSGNWIIINNGTPEPIVIVGISGRADKLVNLDEVESRGIQTMKRFSGGGTVVADENTLFSSILLEFETLKQLFPTLSAISSSSSSSTLPSINDGNIYPKDIMNWSANSFYKHVFHEQIDFSLQENDYAFGKLKFGGNAQSFSKHKFLHHTSFLYDFKDDHMMACLKQPDKIPEYRRNRDHLSFLCKLKDRYQSKDHIINNLLKTINNLPTSPSIKEVTLEEAEQFLSNPHPKSNQLFDYNLKSWKDITNEYNPIKNI
ncbi:hypothetical protein RB653_007213 [Dictyostelium firmibasis]|uniref:BPL/LPL catalytic domain-containing protein n=1 Tax=Dictyostelium firmibasis TaxID=79012 RepID=A0AAN7U0U3_9MYCE